MIDVVFSQAEWRAIAPFAVVSIFAMAVLLYGAFTSETDDETVAVRLLWFSLSGLAAALAATLMFWGRGLGAFGGTFALDGVAHFTNCVCIAAGTLTILMAPSYLPTIDVRAREFYPLVLFAVGGMMILGSAQDLIILFLGVEIMSIPAYVLAGIHRRDKRSGEAALKYFVLGAFATCFLLYGIAVFYGATGATSYAAIAQALQHSSTMVVLAGMALLMVGLGFKVGVVPFHFWAPDVYQGAPTAVTALMAVGIKAAAVAATARLFLIALAGLRVDWGIVLAVMAVLTMTLGNFVAIAQNNVKRMLAYSSIAHAGYLVAGIAAGTPRAGGAVLFYLLAYAFMNLGAFAVVVALGAKGDPNELVSDYSGLGQRRPLLAGAMVLFLLSLAGIPPLVGFAGKLYLLEAMVQSGWIWLAVLVILNSVVSMYYYFRIVMEMFLRDPAGEPDILEARPYLMVCVLVALLGTIWFGVFPDAALQFARDSFLALG